MVVCLSIACGGVRCAGHTREALAAALGRYANAWPAGPEPAVLVAAEIRMGTLHGFDNLADEAAWDGDETAAGRHSWMAERCRESAALARQEQAGLLAAARSRAGRAAPC